MNLLAIVAVAIFALAQNTEGHTNKSSFEEKYRPGKGSYLHYLDNLSTNNRTQFNEECKKRKYDFTVYYRMALFRFCSTSLQDYEAFCDDLLDHGTNKSDHGKQNIDLKAQKYRIYGEGLHSDQRDLAFKACLYIKDYFTKKNQSYTEWLIHAAPFALPTACGFSTEKHKILKPSSYDCMAKSGQALIYFVFAFDALLVACIVVANCVILIVTLRTPRLRTLHGYYRISLACSDLLIGCVLSASMHTTHCMYLQPRPFLEEGQSQKMTHYHSAAYVNAFGFFTVMSFSTSIFTLVAITIERFHTEIAKKRKTGENKTRLVAGLSLAAIWVTSFVIALIPIFVKRYRYTVTALSVIIAPNFYIVYLIFLGLSLLLVWILSVAMCCACAKRRTDDEDANVTVTRNNNSVNEATLPSLSRNVDDQRNVTSHDKMTSSQLDKSEHTRASTSTSHTKDIVLLKTVRTVVAAFTLAIVPAIAVMISGLSPELEPRDLRFDPSAKAAWTSCAYLASRILFGNSFVNAIIYNCVSPQFRTATKRLLGRKRALESTSFE